MIMISIYKIDLFLNKLFKHDYYYLISMTVYHIELILFGWLMIIPQWYNFKTFFPLYFDTQFLSSGLFSFEFGLNAWSIFTTFLILLLDFVFLLIVRNEIDIQQKKHNTVYWFFPSKKFLMLFEIFIFYFSIGNNEMRAILYFMSFNTIQIFITYRIVMRYFKVIYVDKLFILGSYLYIIILTITPLIWFYNIVFNPYGVYP